MNSKNLLPFGFAGIAPHYDKFVAETPLADGVKNGLLTTATIKIVITVTDDFLSENRTRFVIKKLDGDEIFGSGNVDINKTVEIKISSPIIIGAHCMIYATNDIGVPAAPTISTQIITE